MDPATLNAAMAIHLEWGPALMTPTKDRLKKKCPGLKGKALAECDAAAQAAMNLGHRYVYDHPSCTEDECAAAVRASYPWVSAENMRSMYSQGIYYARKDGLGG
jgi:hypothetical protein